MLSCRISSQAVVSYLVQYYNADPNRVTLSGFSRGAIGAWYLGLYNDRISSLFSSFFLYAHCDGEFKGPYPEDDPRDVHRRLIRLRGRPTFLCNCDVRAETRDVTALCPPGACAGIEYASTPFRNHNDQWLLRPSGARARARDWLRRPACERGA